MIHLQLNRSARVCTASVAISLLGFLFGWNVRHDVSAHQQPTNSVVAPPASQQQAAPVVLEAGKPIERELSGGQSHNYQLALSAKQLLNVVTDQRGIDVAVLFFNPDGRKLLEIDSPNGIQGEEAFVAIVEASGIYRIEVRTLDEKAKQGRYQIQVEGLRAATEEDYQIPGLVKSFEHELAGSQKHNYNLALTKGEYLSLIVEQRGIDVVLTLFEPDGTQLAEVDSPNGTQGLEPLHAFIDSGGTYRLEVKSLEKEAKPGKYVITWRKLRQATEKDRILVRVEKLKSQATELWQKKNYNEAATLAEQALALQRQVLGEEHLLVVNSIHNLALLHVAAGNYGKAEPLYRKSQELYRQLLDPEHPYLANNIHNLARVYLDKREYKKAEPLYKQALVIREKLLPSKHADLANTLFDLGITYRGMGAYAKAEPLLQRATDIYEPLGSRWVTTSLIHLAEMYNDWGDHKKAEQTFLRAIEILDKAKNPDAFSMDKAVFLLDLGVTYLNIEEYTKAEQTLLQAMKLFGETRGPECTDVALTLINLGEVHREKGDYAKAEECYLRSKVIYEKSGRKRADLLADLGKLYLAKGENAKAEQFFRQAIEISEEKLGPNHPALASPITGLALAQKAQNSIEQAIANLTRTNRIQEREINQNLLVGSERQMLLALDGLTGTSDNIFTLQMESAPFEQQALRLAVSTVLSRKGRVLDAMTAIFETIRQRASRADQELFEKFLAARAKLANLRIGGAGTNGSAAYRHEVEQQEELVERFEAQITARNQEFRSQFQSVGLSDLQSLIPEKTVLIEFVRYNSLDLKTAKRKMPHYAAYVLPAQGDARWIDLGEATPIEQAVSSLRQALSNPQRQDVKALARDLEAKVFQSVRALLGATTHVLLSPDGALNLLPFAALVDEQGRYLAERYQFSYLTSGRDLLRLQVARDSQQPPLILANPQFDAATMPPAPALAGQDKSKLLAAQRRRAGVRGNDLASLRFDPLSGTAEEAKQLKALFPQARVLTAGQATESALKEAQAPRFLHIATHGFFLANRPQPTLSNTRGLGEQPVLSGDAKLENPLLRSGLALAGANQRRGEGDDGILTALEAAGLNLWGTKLVVLSACETGVGEVKNGEGVYGLRRALVLAGAETQVMSLWKVDDFVTRKWMSAYYKGLLQGRGRGDALRQVQLTMLKEKRTAHPFYWASFIQSGEWANLKGKR